jgi:hypothetical protein
VRWAVIALQQAQRHLSGEQPSLELALTGRMVPEMEFDLLNQIRRMSKPPGSARDLPRSPRMPPMQAAASATTNLPRGANLLDTARRVLLDELLPAMPSGKSYEARMVARAMAVAERELNQRDTVDRNSELYIREFLLDAGLDAGDSKPTEATLARLLRDGAIPPQSAEVLPRLLMTLTRAKLAISNPRYLS